MTRDFFDRDARTVAKDLLGKVLRRRFEGVWLSVAIVETEAYYRVEKGSHASLGRTPSREAVFMPPGTIYMYYSRGADSLNVSCRGPGNAVLIKGGRPFVDRRSPASTLDVMHRLNPLRDRRRPDHRLCAGQTLVCRALDLRVPEWTTKTFDRRRFFVQDVGARPSKIVVARRLGIPKGRDEHLMYRFVDFDHRASATQNPMPRGATAGVDFELIEGPR